MNKTKIKYYPTYLLYKYIVKNMSVNQYINIDNLNIERILDKWKYIILNL